MKKLLPTSLVVLLITTFAFACQSFSSKSITADTKELTIQPFTELSVSGSFEVLFTQEANTTARAEGSTEDIEKIEIETNGDKLILKQKKNSNIKHVVIYLSTPNINEVGIAGSGTFKSTNTITSTKTLHFEIAGSGTITAAIDANYVKSAIAGSGDIHLSGKSSNTKIEIAGSGNYKANDLSTGNTEVEIAGSGNAYVNATGKLSAEIAGSGSIYYKGQPSDIDKSVAGSGKIKPMD